MTREFLAHLGERASRDISQVTRADVAGYRDRVLRRTSRATANKSLKYLRVALGAAWKDGLIERNPAAQVDVIRARHADQNERRPFTLDELKAVLEHASSEWRGMVLTGFYTGQRLGDIARLTWQNVDIERAQLRLVTGKTGRRIELPLAKPLLAHLTTLSASDDPKEPLFPNAYRVATGLRDRSSLSHGFYEILVSAGLASPRTKKSKGEDGKGRRRARVVNALSFHCLRHTATSLLKAAGVSETVAREIIGHDSAAVSRLYTHVSDASKREAVAKLPDVEGITSA